MKTIAAVDLKNGKKSADCRVRFFGEDFHIIYIDTGGDMDAAAEALEKWDGRADALALENIRFPSKIASESLPDQQGKKIAALEGFFTTPVATGRLLHTVCRKWTLAQLRQKYGADLFDDAAILFTSGMADAAVAQQLLEYTDNFAFCDPVLSGGIPKILHSIEDLRLYATYVHPLTETVPAKKLAGMTFFLDACNWHILSGRIKNADIVVVPHHCFFTDIGGCGIDELDGKIVITAAVFSDRLNFLKQRGVRMVIDTIPQMAESIFGPGVLEAMVMVASGETGRTLVTRDIESVLARLQATPRVIFPFNTGNRKPKEE
ncbi:MAG: hypothetical protein R6T92_08590 [Desulfosalsimonadaceae bacterium]